MSGGGTCRLSVSGALFRVCLLLFLREQPSGTFAFRFALLLVARVTVFDNFLACVYKQPCGIVFDVASGVAL
ncbi:MAG: hypothetical protein ACI9OU_001707 [Candidatus Promineifilaceae bacterium]